MSDKRRISPSGIFRFFFCVVVSVVLFWMVTICPWTDSSEPAPTASPSSTPTQPATTQPVTVPTETTAPETTVPETTNPETEPPETAPTTPPPPILEVDTTFQIEREFPGILMWARQEMRDYATSNGLDPNLYFKDLVFSYLLNPDIREFCLEYPRLWDKESTADLSSYENTEGVPLFLQWDSQWGYFDYDGSPLGLAGCGPTTLAMAAYYFTGNPDMNPLSLAQFAMDHGYRYPGNGTAWSFMTSGAQQLGLHSRTLPLHEETMVQALEDGDLIICIMGPGHFTTSGHFILLTGYENGSFTVNDCNSISRSQRTWTYQEISGEILNLWAISG